eukprot:7381844-Prymnesium_polylepis.2
MTAMCGARERRAVRSAFGMASNRQAGESLMGNYSLAGCVWDVRGRPCHDESQNQPMLSSRVPRQAHSAPEEASVVTVRPPLEVGGVCLHGACPLGPRKRKPIRLDALHHDGNAR